MFLIRPALVVALALASLLIGCDRKEAAEGAPTQAPAVEIAPSQAAIEDVLSDDDMADLMDMAIIYMANVKGNPYKAGSEFSFDVALASSLASPACAYGLRVFMPGDIVDLVRAEDVEMGSPPGGIGPLEGEDGKNWRDVLSLGNFANTKKSLVLCRLFFKVKKEATEPYSITLGDDPDNVPLFDIKAEPMPHEFSNEATDPLPKSK